MFSFQGVFFPKYFLSNYWFGLYNDAPYIAGNMASIAFKCNMITKILKKLPVKRREGINVEL